MKSIKLFHYSLALFSLVPAVSLAAVPHIFLTGDPIVASEINNNFNKREKENNNWFAPISSQRILVKGEVTWLRARFFLRGERRQIAA